MVNVVVVFIHHISSFISLAYRRTTNSSTISSYSSLTIAQTQPAPTISHLINKTLVHSLPISTIAIDVISHAFSSICVTFMLFNGLSVIRRVITFGVMLICTCLLIGWIWTMSGMLGGR